MLVDILGGRVVRHGVHLGPLGLVKDGERIVGVVIPLGRHRQNAAGVHVHDDHHAARQRIVVLHGAVQLFFRVVLDHLVDGEHQAVAVLGRVKAVVFIPHVPAGGRLRRHLPPRRAGQHVVVVGLQPRKAVVVGAGKAQHRGGKVAVGVIPL